MNVREMHIEVNQSLQKVAANRTRKLMDQETDWVLNKMVNRTIQAALGKKSVLSLEKQQMALDKFTNLVVVGNEMKAYKSFMPSFISYMPGDYSYLISNVSYVHDNCKGIIQSGLAYTYVSVIPFEKSELALPPFYANVAITISGLTLNIPANLPPSNEYTGYDSKRDFFLLIPFILNYFKARGIDISWEKCGDIKYPGCFIVVSESVITANVAIDANAPYGPRYSTSGNRVLYVTEDVAVAVNRLTGSELIQDFLRLAFYKPSPISPVSEISNGLLRVYTDQNFIVTKTMITYVRKPQIISLDLGTDCDLDPEFHQSICDLAVEYLKGRLQDAAGTQLTVQDNERRVIL